MHHLLYVLKKLGQQRGWLRDVRRGLAQNIRKSLTGCISETVLKNKKLRN